MLYFFEILPPSVMVHLPKNASVPHFEDGLSSQFDNNKNEICRKKALEEVPNSTPCPLPISKYMQAPLSSRLNTSQKKKIFQPAWKDGKTPTVLLMRKSSMQMAHSSLLSHTHQQFKNAKRQLSPGTGNTRESWEIFHCRKV